MLERQDPQVTFSLVPFSVLRLVTSCSFRHEIARPAQ